MSARVMPAMIDYRRPLPLEAPSRRQQQLQRHHRHRDEGLDLECVNRVAHLPLVESVINYAQAVIDSAKDSSLPLVGRTVGVAEGAAKFAAHQAQQVASSFEGPIHLVDSLACRGLDILEWTVPVVKQTPEELVHQAKSYVADRVRPTAELFMTAKDMSQDAAGMAMRQGRRAMDMGTDMAENVLEGAGQAADFGMETSKQAARFGRDKVGQAADMGLEGASRAVRFGREKVGQAADMGSQAMDFGMEKAGQAADMGSEAMNFGKEKLGEGMDKLSGVMDYGREKAHEAMDYGREVAHGAVEMGKETTHEAVEFGKDKAMRAAKSPYGQMVAKRLDKAVIMADTMTDAMMPPDMAEGVRKREHIDAAKAAEEWEPELRPLGHSVAIGTQLFKKLMALMLWQTMGIRHMVALMMMPMIHPLNFADMVITNMFRVPPVALKMTQDMVRIGFNVAMAFTPWRMYRYAMDISGGVRRRLMQAGKSIVQTLYNYVPEEAVQVARQTRTQLEQTKWAGPEFGESLPRSKKGEASPAGSEAGSGYHSEEAEAEHQRKVAERQRLQHEQMTSQLPEKKRDKEVHRRKEHVPLLHQEGDLKEEHKKVDQKFEKERRKKEEERKEAEKKHEEEQKAGQKHEEERKKAQQKHEEERKKAQQKQEEEHEKVQEKQEGLKKTEKKQEEERTKAEQKQEELKKAEQKHEEERKKAAKKEGQETQKHEEEVKKTKDEREPEHVEQEQSGPSGIEDLRPRKDMKEDLQAQTKAFGSGEESEVPALDEVPGSWSLVGGGKQPAAKDKEDKGEDMKAQTKASGAGEESEAPALDDELGGWSIVGGGKQRAAKDKGEDKKKAGNEGPKSGASKDDQSIHQEEQGMDKRRSETEPFIPTGEQKQPAIFGGMENFPTLSETQQHGGAQSSTAPQSDVQEQSGIPDLGYEADVDVPVAEEAGTGEDGSDEHKRVKRDGDGHHEGEHHDEDKHHRAMTPLQEEFTYHGELGDMETLTKNADWHRENMPSVPLDRKSPTHHDVVEEGVIPEVLPELGGESEKKIE